MRGKWGEGKERLDFLGVFGQLAPFLTWLGLQLDRAPHTLH